MTEKQDMLDTAPQTPNDRSFQDTTVKPHRPVRYGAEEIDRARDGSTPEALTIIDPFAAPVRLRRLTDGFDIL